MGVQSSADHYTAPITYTLSSKIAMFFNVVAKKPIPDLVTSLEAFCLSGVDGESAHHHPKGVSTHRCCLPGVIKKLVKDGMQLKGEVAKFILDEMSMFFRILHA